MGALVGASLGRCLLGSCLKPQETTLCGPGAPCDMLITRAYNMFTKWTNWVLNGWVIDGDVETLRMAIK